MTNRKRTKKKTLRLSILLLLLALALALFACATIFASGCATSHNHSSTENLFRQLAPSAVLVETDMGTGSGTVIGRKLGGSLILTCNHVLPPATMPSIRVSNSPDRWTAVVVKQSEKLDLAILWAPGFVAPVVKIADAEPALYAETWIVAAPHGIAGSASTAWLSSKSIRLTFGPGDPRTGARVLLLTGGLTFAGVSGGGVFDSEGSLIAVLEAGSLRQYRVDPLGLVGIQLSQIAYAIPLSDVKSFMAGVL